MIRRTRWRIDAQTLSRWNTRQASTAIRSKLDELSQSLPDSVSEPYGNEYGSGPSRLPYVRGDSSTPETPSQGIRQRLQLLNHGHYAHIPAILQNIGVSSLDQLNRKDLVIIVHHLIRHNKAHLATSLLADAVKHNRNHSPRAPLLIHRATLAALSRQELTNAKAQYGSPKKRQKRTDALLNLALQLQLSRHPRPLDLYQAAIASCLGDARPDKAAAVFVGLVEDWVTEGRIAEGADPEGFHPGGGPPPVPSARVTEQHRSWWTGVRTWKIPGEVLSPHQRQDLWHPHRFSLGERLRSFPIPLATSPPSLVPPPTSVLLSPILSRIRVDPKTTPIEEFESSMRALAILANAIHNRTLPCLSIGPLMDKLYQTPYRPPVYPLDMPSVPENAKWAYEATVHIHLAIQSLVFSPPLSASQFAEAHAHEAVLSGAAPYRSLAQFYRLQPLGFRDCVKLVSYGLSALRLPGSIRKLVEWIKTRYKYGSSRPLFWNVLLRGASELRDHRLASMADDALFAQTSLRRLDSESIDARPMPTIKSRNELVIAPVEDAASPHPDETSLVALLHHLGVTSQHDRTEHTVYSLIPFLDTSTRDPENPSLPAPPVPLTPKLYTAMLLALHLAGRTGLAQRVYFLALQAESQWESTQRLPMELYTIMMRRWASEVSRSQPRADRERGQSWPIGWHVPSSLRGEERHVVASEMARKLYQHANSRWSVEKSGMRPDAEFFQATLDAMSWTWRFRESEWILYGTARDTFISTIRHMDTYNVHVPTLVRQRYDAVQREARRGMEVEVEVGLEQGEGVEKNEEIIAMTPVMWAIPTTPEEQQVHRLRDLARRALQAEEEGLWRDKVRASN